MNFIPVDFPHARLACLQNIILFEDAYCIEKTGGWLPWLVLGYDPLKQHDPVRGVTYAYLTARRVLAWWPWSDLRKAWDTAQAMTNHPAQYRPRIMMRVAYLRGKLTTDETRQELADHTRMQQDASDRRALTRKPKPI